VFAAQTKISFCQDLEFVSPKNESNNTLAKKQEKYFKNKKMAKN